MEDTYMTFQGFHVGIIDLVLVVVGLLFAVSGFKNGFFKEIASIGALIGAVVLSYLLADFVRSLIIANTPIYTLIFENLRNSVFTGNTLYDTVIDSSQAGALEFLTDGLTQIGLPGFLASPLAAQLINFNGTLGDALATSAADLSMLILGYLATFLVGWLLLLIVLKQLVHLTKSVGLFKFIDSILGIVLGLARAALVLAVVLLITIPLSFVVPSIQTFINQDLDLLNQETFSIGKFIYQFVLNFISTIV
jgi:uncharacterized membrane protein required for colicin V production